MIFTLFDFTVSPAQPVPVSTPLTAVVKTEPRDVKTEPRDWESTQPVVATPHTTQHPLDYIQQQLKQANLQPVSKSYYEEKKNDF